MPVKKETKPIKKTVTTTSLRAPKGRGNLIKKIASSKAPRNDDKRPTRGLSVPVYSLTGRASGSLALPKEYFGQKVNKNLLAQALRVYMANQKIHTASTKTRGEVTGSTAKIYKQKGTGRARHGAIRAPIFVGGGITFGPKPKKVKLSLPQKMRKSALISSLSSKMGDKEILGISGMEKATGKTKEMAKLVGKVLSIKYQGNDKKMRSTLIVTGEKMDNVVRGVRNIPGISVLPANQINAYEVLKHDMLILTKEAIEKLAKPKAKEQK